VPEYRIVLTSTAEKELSRLPNQMVSRIFSRIESLANEPRPHGCKKLSAGRDEWRIRIGDYRVIYTIDNEVKKVDVTRIAHRRDVYEKERSRQAQHVHGAVVAEQHEHTAAYLLH